MTEYQTLIEAAVRQMPNGAFLVTGREAANPMTIGWAQWGVVWGKPVLTVLVRHSRFSHPLMDEGVFTVSVPAPGTMRDAIRICGSRSGRDTDKKALAGLTLCEPKENGVPGIAGCAFHFECKTLLKTEVSMDQLQEDLYKRFYTTGQATEDGDPHTLYFGEIAAVYRDGE